MLRVFAWSLFVGLLITIPDNPARADTELEFVHPLTPELRAIVDRFFRHDAAWKKLLEDVSAAIRPVDFDQDISGAFADLDDDGVMEAFFRFDRPDFCGTAGCMFVILKKVGRRWREICGASAQDETITILDRKDHGFHEIINYRDLEGKPHIITWYRGQCE